MIGCHIESLYKISQRFLCCHFSGNALGVQGGPIHVSQSSHSWLLWIWSLRIKMNGGIIVGTFSCFKKNSSRRLIALLNLVKWRWQRNTMWHGWLFVWIQNASLVVLYSTWHKHIMFPAAYGQLCVRDNLVIISWVPWRSVRHPLDWVSFQDQDSAPVKEQDGWY